MRRAKAPIERRESRYALRAEVPVQVRVHRESGPDTVRQGRLLDVSMGGAKLSVDTLPGIDQALELRVVSAALGVELAVSAKVCWVRQAARHRYVLGCAFRPPLPPEALEPFFTRGMLERRRFARHAVAGQAQARWELSEGELPVELLDLSAGGFSLRAPSRAATDGRLMLRVAGPDGSPREVPAKVRWQSAVEGGHVLGCEFVSAEGYPALRSFLGQADEPAAVAGAGRRRLSLFTLVGIVLLLAAVAAHFWLR